MGSAVTAAVAGDLADAALAFYTRGSTFKQTIQDKPLLRTLSASKKTFPSGNQYVKESIQGTFLDSTSGFFAGYTDDEVLVFKNAANIDQSSWTWKEVHAGLAISWTELKYDGITITDGKGLGSKSDHADALTRLVPILENRLEDFGESWSREMNEMLWKDGSQDSEQAAGVLSIITDTPAVGTVGGIDAATLTWWRHRASVGGSKITASAANQTLSKHLRSELRQLRRYGGRPNVALAGSGFLEALELEVQEKGIYTQTGFTNKGQNDMGMAEITMTGLGTFTYDPTLDDLGMSKRCFVIDSRKLLLRPMEGEENKVISPERPHDQLVFLRSMTWTGTLTCRQRNALGVYEVA